MKTCIQCNNAFEPKRSDAKFCCSTCKAKHWENKKVEMPHVHNNDNKISNALRGVISESTLASSKSVMLQNRTSLMPVETAEYKEFKHNLNILQTSKKRLEKEINQLHSHIQEIKSNDGSVLTFLTTMSSAAIAYQKTRNGWFTLLGGTFGYGAGKIMNSLSNEGNEQIKQLEIINTEQKIIELNVSLTSINNQISELNTKMIGVRMFEHKPVQSISMFIPTTEIAVQNQIETIQAQSDFSNPPDGDVPIRQKANKDSKSVIPKKIICSLDLQKFKYKALNFQGKWADFFGLPSINFHLALHGMSGEGKSTFAIQFAKYLAQNFGKVIYISGEESFAKTFNDKLTNNNAACPELFVADLHSFEDIIKEVAIDAYNFILFDSLDDLCIDAKKMKEIRKVYKDCALITISQSTKDGKMRGSYQIIHDSDMAVKVENGIATTTKNRFKQKGMKLTVFESLERI